MQEYKDLVNGRVEYSEEDICFPFHSFRHLNYVCNVPDSRTAWRELGILAALNLSQLAFYSYIILLY